MLAHQQLISQGFHINPHFVLGHILTHGRDVAHVQTSGRD